MADKQQGEEEQQREEEGPGGSSCNCCSDMGADSRPWADIKVT